MADVKRWIHDAYAMQLTRREGGGGDAVSGRLYGMARAVWMGKIMCAVENQPRPYPELLQFLYAPEYTDTQLRTLKRAAVGAVIKAEREKGMKAIQDRTFLKLLDLAEVALFEYRAEQRGGGRIKQYLIPIMAGIDPGNWRNPDRYWQARYKIMMRSFPRWERAGLRQPRAVAEEIEAAKEEERQTG